MLILDTKNSGKGKQKIIIIEKDKTSFTIGRDIKCNLPFVEDKAFSKIHASIFYDYQLYEWKIIDGDMEKNSTNGIW